MHLGKRIAKILQEAGLTARDLQAVTQIHFTTIYNQMKGDDDYKFTPLTEDVLVTALAKIERLIADGLLPLRENVSAKERCDRLLSMLAVTRH